MKATFLAARRGFTLIELLTVIAIVGILAAIIIPTVGAVRNTAKGAKCVSNLRTLAQAALTYAADNKNFAPPPNLPASGSTPAQNWAANSNFRTYWRPNVVDQNTNLLTRDSYCPFALQYVKDHLDGNVSIEDSGGTGVIGSIGRSYGYNGHIIGPNGNINTNLAINLAKLQSPSRTICFADAADPIINFSGVGKWTETSQTLATGNMGQSAIAPRHKGKAHVAMFDASVRAMSVDDYNKIEIWEIR